MNYLLHFVALTVYANLTFSFGIAFFGSHKILLLVFCSNREEKWSPSVPAGIAHVFVAQTFGCKIQNICYQNLRENSHIVFGHLLQLFIHES